MACNSTMLKLTPLELTPGLSYMPSAMVRSCNAPTESPSWDSEMAPQTSANSISGFFSRLIPRPSLPGDSRRVGLVVLGLRHGATPVQTVSHMLGGGPRPGKGPMPSRP